MKKRFVCLRDEKFLLIFFVFCDIIDLNLYKFFKIQEKTMKKLLALILALTLIFCATSCGRDVTMVTVSKTELVVNAGETANLTAKVSPVNARDKTVEWYSSNDGVCTVENGKVTGVHIGEADITVYAEGGFTATCHVTVITCLKHDFDEWIDVSDSTCVEPGIRVHVCRACELEEEEEKPLSDNHRFVAGSCVWCDLPDLDSSLDPS